MVNREGKLNKGTSIQAGHIKSRFLLMPALARDTMWFTTSAVAYLSARAGITFGEMTLDITSSASRPPRTIITRTIIRRVVLSMGDILPEQPRKYSLLRSNRS